MYDELVKRLRNCATQAAPCKTCDMTEDDSCSDTLMKQAADAIDELVGFVQEAERDRDEYRERLDKANDVIEELSKPRWIPANEQMPELHDEEYLDEVTGEVIRYKESNPILIWLENGGFMDIGIYEKSDAIDDFCYQGVPATVTYWMPLPEPPKEET